MTGWQPGSSPLVVSQAAAARPRLWACRGVQVRTREPSPTCASVLCYSIAPLSY